MFAVPSPDPLQALLERTASAALHFDGSPPPPGLVGVATLPRLNAGECLVGAAELGALEAGATLAVVDERARLVVNAIRDDLRIEVSGSPRAALAMLDGGGVAAALIGRCDLDRLDRGDEAGQTFEEMAFLPPPGRGAASLLVREDDAAAAAQLAPLDDPDGRAALGAELAFEAAAPDGFAVGAYAMVDDELLALRALLGRSDDGRLWFGDGAGPPSTAGELGRGLAARLAEAVD